jgi:hypothetical protein
MANQCTHLDQIREVTPSANGCEECLKTGDTWVHLRLCLSCGHVGCCDSSKNTHATKHFHATGHPIIQSVEPGEDWAGVTLTRLDLRLPEHCLVIESVRRATREGVYSRRKTWKT